jgi:hypothetical protein
MNKKILCVFILIQSCFLFACSPSNADTQEQIKGNPSATPFQFTSTVQNTKDNKDNTSEGLDKIITPDNIFLSKTPVSPGDNTPFQEIALKCVQTGFTSHGDVSLSGKVGVQSVDDQPSYLLDFDNGVKSDIKGKVWNVDHSDFSPDGKMILLHEFITPIDPNSLLRVSIVDDQGKSINTFVTENDWKDFGWFDNEKLWVSRSVGQGVSSFSIYNPWKNTFEKVINPDFPGVFQYSGRPVHIVYDPSLLFVVYPKLENQQFYWVLWDISRRKQVISLPTENVFESTPIWAPDGSGFLIALIKNTNMGNKSDLYKIDLNGVTQRLTDLSENGNQGVVHSYYWSPSSKTIVFWYTKSAKVDQVARLAVANLVTGTLLDLCILGDLSNPATPWGSPIIWSPFKESDFIIYIIDKNQEYDTLLIDLNDPLAIDLGKNIYPVFWAKTFPNNWPSGN